MPFPTLPTNATKVHIFPTLHSALISIGQLCDSDCTVTFKKTTAFIYNAHDVLIAKGQRDTNTGMWNIPLPIPPIPNAEPTPIALANGIIKRDTPITDLCQALHAALFSPTTSTLEQAIKNGFLDSFPGLSLHTVRKFKIPSPKHYYIKRAHDSG